jgi:hypothetical protein
MATLDNVKLKRGRMADETVVLFRGSPIGTLKRIPHTARRKDGVKWAIHTFDDHQHVQWCADRRYTAIYRLIRYYLNDTGSHSGRHNDWVRRVRARLNGIEV